MSKIKIYHDADVMVITVDNPPINAGSIEVRQGLLDAIHAVDADHKLTAAVIIGGGTTFIAGSDIKEFSQPLMEPHLPLVIAAIENCAKPVVCALHGAALGGGFELALGCDARIALEGTVLGLPEVTLGIIPGAGGTQRLPRSAERPSTGCFRPGPKLVATQSAGNNTCHKSALSQRWAAQSSGR